MSVLFDKDTDTVGLHVRNAFKEGELKEESTTEEFSVVQNEGNRPVRRTVQYHKKTLPSIRSFKEVISACGCSLRGNM